MGSSLFTVAFWASTLFFLNHKNSINSLKQQRNVGSRRPAEEQNADLLGFIYQNVKHQILLRGDGLLGDAEGKILLCNRVN